MRVHANGTLKPVDELDDVSPLRLGGAHNVDVFKMGDRTYALVASWSDDGVQSLRVHDNGTLEPVHQIGGDNSNSNALELNGAIYADAFEMGGRTFAAVVSTDDDGVQLLRVHDNGTLEAAGRASDGGGFSLDGPHGVDAFEMGGATYAAVAARDDDGVQLVRVHDDGMGLSPAGLASNGAHFPRLDGPHHVDAFEVGNRTYALALSQQGGGGVQLIRLSPASVTGVTTALPDGEYPQGHRIGITVEFDEPVSVSGPPPSLLLTLDDGNRTAEYASGSGTRSLEFSYAVQPGDEAARLDYAGAGALTTRGVVADLRATEGGSGGSAADLELPAPGDAGSLAHTKSIAVVGSALAYVEDVSSPNASGFYVEGDAVDIVVRFSVPVDVAGEPALALNTNPPRNATYVQGGGIGGNLTFRYAVQPGDNAADLDYAGAAALALGAGDSIRDPSDGAAAVLALPPPGGPGSLGRSNHIAIDAVAPRLLGTSSPDPDDTYGTGRIVNVTVSFDEPVVVGRGGGGGAPSLDLNTEPPRNAAYASGSGTGPAVVPVRGAAGRQCGRLGLYRHRRAAPGRLGDHGSGRQPSLQPDPSSAGAGRLAGRLQGHCNTRRPAARAGARRPSRRRRRSEACRGPSRGGLCGRQRRARRSGVVQRGRPVAARPRQRHARGPRIDRQQHAGDPP